jgi:hypothetical protein
MHLGAPSVSPIDYLVVASRWSCTSPPLVGSAAAGGMAVKSMAAGWDKWDKHTILETLEETSATQCYSYLP